MSNDELLFEEFNEFMHSILSFMEKLKSQEQYQHITSLSNSAIAVLMCIPKEESRNFKEITTQLGLPKSTMTGIVRQLESQGYLAQRVNNVDKRRRDLYLTDKGWETQKEHDMCEQQIYHIFTGKLDLKEKTMLLSLLSKGLEGTGVE